MKISRGIARRLLVGAACLTFSSTWEPTATLAQGAGDLLVAPTRVVLEGRQRTAELTLINTGSKTATYRISFVQVRMDEFGGTKQIDTPGPGELFADALIRYSPRQVVLEPNVSQTVRLQLRKPADLPPGEYRSNLLFRAVPSSTPTGATTGLPEEASKEFSIKLTPIYGVSVPIIVRHGETAAHVTLADLELVPPSDTVATPLLRLRMNRSGNRSVHGDFTVTFVPAAGKPVIVGLVQGVAIYTPNPLRRIGIALRPPPGTILRTGSLRVIYTTHTTVDETLAEAELRIP